MHYTLGLVETDVAALLDRYAAIVAAVTQVTLGAAVLQDGQVAFAQLRAWHAAKPHALSFKRPYALPVGWAM